MSLSQIGTLGIFATPEYFLLGHRIGVFAGYCQFLSNVDVKRTILGRKEAPDRNWWSIWQPKEGGWGIFFHREDE